jgi:PAS domain S-box-containing protein
MRVLVVDDDDAGLYLAATIVASGGHEALKASNGLEALEVARAHPPDVLITDILMPGMDGYQLAREWKQDPALSAIPLIFLTASYTDPADEKFAIELGADGFLSKPVDQDVLLEMIDTVTRESSGPGPRAPMQRTEEQMLREYSDRVVHKLEQKVLDLERSNTMLESAMTTLSEEVEAKAALISELGAEVTRRKAREEELSEQIAFNRSIIETADVFIMVIDPDARITLFSPGAERASGYAASETIGADYVDLFAPEDEREMRRGLVESVLRGHGPTRLTTTIVIKSGEKRMFEWSLALLDLEEQGMTGMIAFGIDVTARTVSTATERVSSVVDLAVLQDRHADEVLDLACAQAADEFRLPGVWVSLTNGSGVLEVRAAAGPLTPELARLPVERVEEILAPDGILGLEEGRLVSLPSGDGGWWDEFSDRTRVKALAIVPVREHGRVLGLLGTVDRQHGGFGGGSLEALGTIADRLGVALLVGQARSQLLLQSAALESSASAIVIADVDGRVLWTNPAFAELTGWTSDEVTGAMLFAEGEGYHEPGYAQGWRGVIEGMPWRAEITNTTRQGAQYFEDVTAAPVRDERGEISHVVLVKQDVTEARRLEQLKSDFVAMVSHELRTPLTSIIGYADLVAANLESLEPARTATALASIQLNGRRMQGIVEELLEANEMQAEGVELDLREVRLQDLVKEVVAGVDVSERHTLGIEYAPDLPVVCCDARRIGRALRNLLSNAVKYSPEGGPVTVTVTVKNGGVAIAVRDRGIGIAEARLPELCEAFHQEDMSSTRAFGGVGLGLFIAQRFVAAHGGSIDVESLEGEGSTFTIMLPVKPVKCV